MPKRGNTMQANVAQGWGSCYVAAELLGVSHMTVRRAAEANELRHRRVKSRLLIWLPDLVPGTAPPAPDKPATPQRKRGRPKNTDRRK
jgi:excisionase family DNA binding protein